MDTNEGILIVKKIEDIYEEVFTRKGMGLFMRMAWLHVKDECDEKDIADISYKLMIEELIFYGLATHDKYGYKKIAELLRKKDSKLKIKPYQEMMEYYEDYIMPLREFFKKNPDRKKELFDVWFKNKNCFIWNI